MIRTRHFSVAAFALCAACSGTETGNPPGASVAFVLVTSDPSVASTGTGIGHIIQSFRLSLQSMALLDCNGRDVGSAGNAGTVDLVAGSNSVSVPAGDYCGARVGFAPIDGRSAIIVTGTRTDGLPFGIQDPNPVTITIASTAPFTIHEGEPLLVAFDVALWFGGTFLQDAAAAGWHVTIDATSNSSALAPFESQSAAELYRDPNSDGQVDHSDGPAIASGHSLHTP